MEHSFIWCWNSDASGSISETTGKFWNVCSADHVRNEEVVLKIQGAEEYPALNKETEV